MKTDTLAVPGAELYYEVRDESAPGQMTYQTSYALAGELGEPPVEFPGGHGGFDSHPDGFAATLRKVLAATRS
jgi:hypothetical protein